MGGREVAPKLLGLFADSPDPGRLAAEPPVPGRRVPPAPAPAPAPASFDHPPGNSVSTATSPGAASDEEGELGVVPIARSRSIPIGWC